MSMPTLISNCPMSALPFNITFLLINEILLLFSLILVNIFQISKKFSIFDAGNINTSAEETYILKFERSKLKLLSLRFSG